MSVFDPLSGYHDPRSYTPTDAGHVKSLEEHRADFAKIFAAKMVALQTAMRDGSIGGLRNEDGMIDEITLIDSQQDPMERRMTAWERLNNVYQYLIGA